MFNFRCNLLGQKKNCAVIHGKNPERVTCELCGKAYKSKQYLRMHMKYDHQNAAAIACDICGTMAPDCNDNLM